MTTCINFPVFWGASAPDLFKIARIRTSHGQGLCSGQVQPAHSVRDCIKYNLKKLRDALQFLIYFPIKKESKRESLKRLIGARKMNDVKTRRLESLQYVQSMLGQLRQMTDAERCDMLSYLIEMAYVECSDMLRGDRPLRVQEYKRHAAA